MDREGQRSLADREQARPMQTVVIVVHLMLVLAMIGLVLLQKSEGGGLGIGSSGGFMSSRGTTNVLTRTTAILAASFFATSLILSVLAGMQRNPSTILRGGTPGAPASTPGAPAPKPGGPILDQLKQLEQQPKGPQAPQSK
jgi:preprotein translocase subunit SecG